MWLLLSLHVQRYPQVLKQSQSYLRMCTPVWWPIWSTWRSSLAGVDSLPDPVCRGGTGENNCLILPVNVSSNTTVPTPGTFCCLATPGCQWMSKGTLAPLVDLSPLKPIKAWVWPCLTLKIEWRISWLWKDILKSYLQVLLVLTSLKFWFGFLR